MATIGLPAERTPEFQALLEKIESIDNERLIEAIPKELFEPKIWRGMLGFFSSSALYVGAIVGVAYTPYPILYVPLWFAAGLGAWGLFCINHDCGHHSFSRSRRFNSILGHISMLPMLYPHHGWRHMHNLHHSHTNDLELDTDWRPMPRSQFLRMNLWDRLVYSGVRSWFWWLGTVDYQRHCFQPGFFPKREARNDVRRSIAIVLLFAAVYLPLLVYFTGFTGLLLYFVMPWIAFHVWFSTTTMMHHTTNELPFLTKQFWTVNASRLLLTTDYNYSKWLHFFTHNITVHTAHHVAPITPFYNLPKAREAIKRVYPDMVREKKFTFRELFQIIRSCHFYDPMRGYYVAFGEQRAFPGKHQHTGLKLNNTDKNHKMTNASEGAQVFEQHLRTPVDPDPLPMAKRIGKGYMNVLGKFSTAAAGRRAADIFGYTRTFSKKPPKDIAPLGARSFPIQGTVGITKGYQWGKSSKTVLLVHGWGSDSSTMYSFVRSFVNAGFRVATFDAPAHGVSPGNVTTMTNFNNAVREAIVSLGDVVAVVAHSIGSITSIGAINELADRHKIQAICMLAPPANLPLVIERWSNSFLKMNDDVIDQMYAELQRRNGVPVQHWDVVALGRDMRIPILILHDPADTVIPVQDAELIAKSLPQATLEKVPGAGRHLRILSHAPVIDRVCRFVTEHTRTTPNTVVAVHDNGSPEVLAL